jgi:hypothetical protein
VEERREEAEEWGGRGLAVMVGTNGNAHRPSPIDSRCIHVPPRIYNTHDDESRRDH